MVINNQGETDNQFNGLFPFLFFNAACGKQAFFQNSAWHNWSFGRAGGI
jgi:hypothetical protein